MRRLFTYAAFFLIISIVPVCAQRGGRGFGGSHGGFSGARGGSGGHTGFASHSFGGPGFGGSHFTGSGFSRSGMGSHFGSGFGFRGDRFRGSRFDRGFRRDHGFRHHCFGCGFGFTFGFDPWWDYWWWDSHSSYDEDAARERELANEMNSQNLEEQRMLREQDQDLYARPAAQPREEEHAQNDPATVLVFRDQHQREIQNYAIADGILWNFMPQRTEKIPLAILDIPATEKANDDRGVEFHLPPAGEGQ
jgi:hypothetical protein